MALCISGLWLCLLVVCGSVHLVACDNVYQLIFTLNISALPLCVLLACGSVYQWLVALCISGLWRSICIVQTGKPAPSLSFAGLGFAGHKCTHSL